MERRLWYVPIDFVGSIEKTIEFEEKYVDTLLEARQRISDNSLPIKLALKTTFVAEGNARDLFYKGISRLRKNDIGVMIDEWESGPTRTVYDILFGHGYVAARCNAPAISNLDHCPPHKNLENLLSLYDALLEKNGIVGFGSRDIPIVLSHNTENGYLRRIFEGVIGIAARNAPPPNKIHLPKDRRKMKDPAYEKHGDLVPGTYILNTEHRQAKRLMERLISEARDHKFFGFESQYSLAVTAPSLGNVVAQLMRSEDNPFNPMSVEEEKKWIIQKQIKDVLKKLKGTYAGDMIAKVLNSNSIRELYEFYTTKQVNEVMQLMHQALAEK
jgi:hypothetical protein